MAGSTAQPFVLCADDFGFTAGVSEGILDLAAKHRLSAVGCMMTQQATRDGAAALEKHRDKVAIGVHLVLTDMQALTPGLRQLPGIGALTRAALKDALPKADIKHELARQLEAFVQSFGRVPDFIDGHHHVHQLPGVRGMLLDLIIERFPGELPSVRSCTERPSRIFKRRVSPFKAAAVGVFGAALRRDAEALNLHVNNGFSGIYDFSGRVPYGDLFDRFTDGLRPGALVMCHPGKVDNELRALDSVTDQREAELSYFLSDDFPALLKRKKLCLEKFAPRAHNRREECLNPSPPPKT